MENGGRSHSRVVPRQMRWKTRRKIHREGFVVAAMDPTQALDPFPGHPLVSAVRDRRGQGGPKGLKEGTPHDGFRKRSARRTDMARFSVLRESRGETRPLRRRSPARTSIVATPRGDPRSPSPSRAFRARPSDRGSGEGVCGGGGQVARVPVVCAVAGSSQWRRGLSRLFDFRGIFSNVNTRTIYLYSILIGCWRGSVPSPSTHCCIGPPIGRWGWAPSWPCLSPHGEASELAAPAGAGAPLDAGRLAGGRRSSSRGLLVKTFAPEAEGTGTDGYIDAFPQQGVG